MPYHVLLTQHGLSCGLRRRRSLMALLGRVFLRIRQPVYAQSHSPAKAHERYFAGASHPWYVCKRPRGTLRIPERLEEKMGERALAFLDGREKCMHVIKLPTSAPAALGPPTYRPTRILRRQCHDSPGSPQGRYRTHESHLRVDHAFIVAAHLVLHVRLPHERGARQC